MGTVPCCKTIKIKHPILNGGKIFGLTDNVLGGRGVWESADEEVIFYHKQTSSLDGPSASLLSCVLQMQAKLLPSLGKMKIWSWNVFDTIHPLGNHCLNKIKF